MCTSPLHEPVASSKGRRVYKALLRIGWHEHHIVQGSSHQQLRRSGYEDFTWAFHDADEMDPKMPARIAKKTGLTPQDL